MLCRLHELDAKAKDVKVAVRHKRKIEDDEGHSWRERLRALRYVPLLVKLVWQTHRGYTDCVIALRLLLCGRG